MCINISGITETQCCGCGACYQICPKHCIIKKQNERGFYVPVLTNETECIGCGACIRVCPEKSHLPLKSVLAVYAAVCKNEKILNVSTSGGVFSILAQEVLENNGYVYGCTLDQDLKARYIEVKNTEDLWKIQKSKYIQADTMNTFVMAKKALGDGHMVLYSGTACQIAGLRKFLNKDDENLITVEVACHGVPSQGLFDKYVIWQNSRLESEIVDVQFRNKVMHKKGEHYKICLKMRNGRDKYLFANEDPYYGSFLMGTILRKTCYDCRYKNNDRVADILLGDFWGIEKEHPKFPAARGASAVVINSEKGKKLFDNIRDKLIVEESTFEKVVAHNGSIISCAQCQEEKRLTDIEENLDILFNNLKPNFSLKRRLKNLIPEEIKYVIKRL